MSADPKAVDVLAAWDRQIEWLRDLVATNPGSECHTEELQEAIDARAAVAELIEAARPLVARSFEEARDNEDQRIAARKSGAYPPPEMLWCRADALNPCWVPGTPYTGKHWGWTPDMQGDGEVCEHCRLRAALARCGGAS